MSLVALIPARAGSVRVLGKNTRLLGGVPLWKHTERVAFESRLFSGVYICTDDPAIMSDPTLQAGLLPRSPESALSTSPDIMWVREALEAIPRTLYGPCPTALCILRPTSPFRTQDMLKRAWAQFEYADADSLRAVSPAPVHPGKMWYCTNFMEPVLKGEHPDGTPWHSSPTQTLWPVYVQNASLEIVWTAVIYRGSLSGRKILPFYTHGLEGFDINTEADFAEAERLIQGAA